MTRHSVTLLLGLLAGAENLTGEAPPDCAQAASEGAALIDWKRPPDLVGTYDIVMVDTAQNGEPAVYGRLRLALARPDSAMRRVWGPLLHLVGTIISPAEVFGVRQKPSDRPDIALTSKGTLVLGQFMYLDGVGDRLELTTASAKGFFGNWFHSSGIAVVVRRDSTGTKVVGLDHAGYFCARLTRE